MHNIEQQDGTNTTLQFLPRTRMKYGHSINTNNDTAGLKLKERCCEMSNSVIFVRRKIHVVFHKQCILQILQMFLYFIHITKESYVNYV
jgi:hypothetical protein